jgi:hypothetical protein
LFSPLLIPSGSRFVLLFNYPFPYLGPYILLNIFLSKINTAFSSFFVIVHVSAPYDTTGLISVLSFISTTAKSWTSCILVVLSFIIFSQHNKYNKWLLSTIVSGK